MSDVDLHRIAPKHKHYFRMTSVMIKYRRQSIRMVINT